MHVSANGQLANWHFTWLYHVSNKNEFITASNLPCMLSLHYFVIRNTMYAVKTLCALHYCYVEFEF